MCFITQQKDKGTAPAPQVGNSSREHTVCLWLDRTFGVLPHRNFTYSAAEGQEGMHHREGQKAAAEGCRVAFWLLGMLQSFCSSTHAAHTVFAHQCVSVTQCLDSAGCITCGGGCRDMQYMAATASPLLVAQRIDRLALNQAAVANDSVAAVAAGSLCRCAC